MQEHEPVAVLVRSTSAHLHTFLYWNTCSSSLMSDRYSRSTEEAARFTSISAPRGRERVKPLGVPERVAYRRGIEVAAPNTSGITECLSWN